MSMSMTDVVSSTGVGLGIVGSTVDTATQSQIDKVYANVNRTLQLHTERHARAERFIHFPFQTKASDISLPRARVFIPNPGTLLRKRLNTR
ncbi:MAG: hypothetical protein P8176_04910 [Gammaproteobacteria bacterium]